MNIVWRQRQAELSINLGRERVREAERGVEGALAARGSVAQVAGDLYFSHPVQLVAEDAEEAPPEDAEEAQSEERELARARRRIRNLPTAQHVAVEREADLLAQAAAQREARDLALAELWKLTHRRLDLYHEIATNQARRSFTSAQISMGIGFGLLVLFVVLALNVSDTAGAIVTGGLGAVSAALAGFISKTFVTSQQAAAEHLKAYFDQLAVRASWGVVLR